MGPLMPQLYPWSLYSCCKGLGTNSVAIIVTCLFVSPSGSDKEKCLCVVQKKAHRLLDKVGSVKKLFQKCLQFINRVASLLPHPLVKYAGCLVVDTGK